MMKLTACQKKKSWYFKNNYYYLWIITISKLSKVVSKSRKIYLVLQEDICTSMTLCYNITISFIKCLCWFSFIYFGFFFTPMNVRKTQYYEVSIGENIQKVSLKRTKTLVSHSYCKLIWIYYCLLLIFVSFYIPVNLNFKCFNRNTYEAVKNINPNNFNISKFINVLLIVVHF